MALLLFYWFFIYDTYIKEDWSVINKFGRIVLKPFYYIRYAIIVLYSIVCFPLVLLHIGLSI